MNLLKIILWPFSALYGFVVIFRNWLYDRRFLKQQSFDLPLIAFGNLRVGGTGKTPHLIWTARKLSSYRLAILSRGYRRQSKGFVLLSNQTNASVSGDEPFLIRKSLVSTPVAVCENRVEGVLKLLTEEPETECILLDDAYQHRALKAGFYVLLTPYNHPWYGDALLPAGRLREPVSGRKRAHCIIVSQCPYNLSKKEAAFITKQLRPDRRQQVLFSIKRPAVPEELKGKEVYLASGLGDNAQFAESLSNQVTIIHHFQFPDHHAYSDKDLEHIWKRIQQKKAPLLLSAKDMVKLHNRHSKLSALMTEVTLDIDFLFDGETVFLQALKSFIESHRDRFGDISNAV